MMLNDPPSAQAKPERLGRDPVPIAILAAAAMLLRAVDFGNPVVHPDEQFYRLVGNRMLAGALPYVDLWDRKPVGLFALYAVIQALGGPGPLAAQLAAFVSAVATAWLIGCGARRLGAQGMAPLAAGLVYLVWADMLGGEAGQTPVFFNLPMVAAALLVLSAVEGSHPGSAGRRGAAAMLLVGLAMQIKYTAVFEGVYFGLALIWATHRHGRSPAAILRLAAVWILCALAPTLLALGVYAAHGLAATFMQANFASIFQRAEPDHRAAWERLLTAAAMIGPLAVLAGLGLGREAARPPARGFVRGWVTVATLAYLGFGGWYDHYALPLLVPLAIAAAPMLRLRWWTIALLLVGVAGAALTVAGHRRTRGDGHEARALAGAIRPHLGGGALWVYAGDPVLYDLTGATPPTRFAFPSHLNHLKEAGALGISRDAELDRILRHRPAVIVTADPLPDTVDPASAARVARTLADDYRLIARQPLGRTYLLAYAALPPAHRTRQGASNRISAGPR